MSKSDYGKYGVGETEYGFTKNVTYREILFYIKAEELGVALISYL